jgi:hypothetical protein
MSNLRELEKAATPAPWLWYYNREGVYYETRTDDGWLIEEREVDTEVPEKDWPRGPAGSVSLRCPDGNEKYPDLPQFVLWSVDEPPSEADALLIPAMRDIMPKVFDLVDALNSPDGLFDDTVHYEWQKRVGAAKKALEEEL